LPSLLIINHSLMVYRFFPCGFDKKLDPTQMKNSHIILHAR